MQWTYLIDTDLPEPSVIIREADPEIPFEHYLIQEANKCLATALDFFLTSSYTYTDADGFNHIGWLAGNLYAD